MKTKKKINMFRFCMQAFNLFYFSISSGRMFGRLFGYIIIFLPLVCLRIFIFCETVSRINSRLWGKFKILFR